MTSRHGFIFDQAKDIRYQLPLISALWQLSRPKLALYVVFVALCGYGWALWDRALSPVNLFDLGLMLLAWYFLQVGTIWLNADLDRDEGEVLFGQSLLVPQSIHRAVVGAFAVSCVLSAFVDWLLFFVTTLCVGLSYLYSHPRFALKGHSVAGPIINLVGYGLATPFVGWAIADVSPNLRTLIVWMVAAVGLLGCYWASQAFQREDDLRRGYHTLVVLIGSKNTILVGRLCTAFCALATAMLILMGWLPVLSSLLLVVWFWIDRWYVLWACQDNGGGEYYARVLAQRLFIAVGLTLLLAVADCLIKSAAELPVAGLSTLHGVPVDRPLLPPKALAIWEKQHGRFL